MVSGPAPGMRSNHWFLSPLSYSRAQLSRRHMRFESCSLTTWTCGMKGSLQPSSRIWKERCWSSLVLPPCHRMKSQLHAALMTQNQKPGITQTLRNPPHPWQWHQPSSLMMERYQHSCWASLHRRTKEFWVNRMHRAAPPVIQPSLAPPPPPPDPVTDPPSQEPIPPGGTEAMAEEPTNNPIGWSFGSWEPTNIFVICLDAGADLPNFWPTEVDGRLDAVFGDHPHHNNGCHLSNGVQTIGSGSATGSAWPWLPPDTTRCQVVGLDSDS